MKNFLIPLIPLILMTFSVRSQCSGGSLWTPVTPPVTSLIGTGTVQGSVAMTVVTSGNLRSDRPIYIHLNDTYLGNTYRSTRLIRGHATAFSATATYVKFALPMPSNAVHFRVGDLRGDNFNWEPQRIEGYNNGVPVTPTFEDFVNGANITGAQQNIINGSTSTTSTVQSSVRVFFSGPVDSVRLVRTGYSDFVTFDILSRCDLLLPFTLSFFEATRIKETVQLKWKTSEAWNFNQFLIQHSTNGTEWQEIGRKNIGDISGSANTYQFTHEDPEQGRNFYRLKSIDIDGLVTYSEIASVQFSGLRSGRLISSTQNPFGDKLVLNCKTEGVLTIYSADGRLTLNRRLTKGTHQIESAGWTKGVYFVRMISGVTGQTQTIKLIKGE